MIPELSETGATGVMGVMGVIGRLQKEEDAGGPVLTSASASVVAGVVQSR